MRKYSPEFCTIHIQYTHNKIVNAFGVSYYRLNDNINQTCYAVATFLFVNVYYILRDELIREYYMLCNSLFVFFLSYKTRYCISFIFDNVAASGNVLIFHVTCPITRIIVYIIILVLRDFEGEHSQIVASKL